MENRPVQNGALLAELVHRIISQLLGLPGSQVADSGRCWSTGQGTHGGTNAGKVPDAGFAQSRSLLFKFGINPSKNHHYVLCFLALYGMKLDYYCGLSSLFFFSTPSTTILQIDWKCPPFRILTYLFRLKWTCVLISAQQRLRKILFFQKGPLSFPIWYFLVRKKFF